MHTQPLSCLFRIFEAVGGKAWLEVELFVLFELSATFALAEKEYASAKILAVEVVQVL